jgi:hypothetical protein
MIEKPLVFVIDIDGCLLGDITPQLMLYEIINELKKHHIKISMNLKDFQYKLKHGIVRPYFQKFIKSIKNHIPNSEFYIYTASQKQWAEFLIKNIEKALTIKFNRPIFTRDNCIIINNEFKKSLKGITPIIQKSLKKKYGIVSLENRIVMIDNNNVLGKSEQNSLVICPSYKYYKLENLPLFIKPNIYNQHYDIINTILKKYVSIKIDNITNYENFEKAFYTYYISQINPTNNKELEDKYWYNLTKLIIIKNIKYLGHKSVEYIKKKMCV